MKGTTNLFDCHYSLDHYAYFLNFSDMLRNFVLSNRNALTFDILILNVKLHVIYHKKLEKYSKNISIIEFER